MATNNELSESVTKLLECSICFEQMSIPKVLPCQHTFCLNCLKRTADSAQTPSPDLILNNSVTIIILKKICCAICRKKHKVPNEGVKGFPNNLTLMTLIDSMKYSANKKRKGEANTASATSMASAIVPRIYWASGPMRKYKCGFCGIGKT